MAKNICCSYRAPRLGSRTPHDELQICNSNPRGSHVLLQRLMGPCMLMVPRHLQANTHTNKIVGIHRAELNGLLHSFWVGLPSASLECMLCSVSLDKPLRELSVSLRWNLSFENARTERRPSAWWQSPVLQRITWAHVFETSQSGKQREPMLKTKEVKRAADFGFSLQKLSPWLPNSGSLPWVWG